MATHFALADTAVVRVTGEDAATFLQGQCTADLRGVTSADALWLNRKGRVLAHTVVSKEADGSFLLLAPHLTAEALLAVVTANVIADDVVATDESASWRRAIADGWRTDGRKIFRPHTCGARLHWVDATIYGAAMFDGWAMAHQWRTHGRAKYFSPLHPSLLF